MSGDAMISRVQRNAIETAISLNPTIITITRVEYVEDEGARKRVETTISPQTWLVYQESFTSISGSTKKTEGRLADEYAWGALAPHCADVKWGPNVQDILSIPGVEGSFVVVAGRPLTVGDALNGYELKLKQVK